MSAQDEIPEELIANIPVVDEEGGDTVFVPVSNEEETTMMSTQNAKQSALADQMRYEMGEAFARELDRAANMVAGAVADLEAQLARLHEQVTALQNENEELRSARTEAERKLNAFKELALGR